ncbi:MAG: DUF4142 domain-containing protein [Janthinobacterium lividum]
MLTRFIFVSLACAGISVAASAAPPMSAANYVAKAGASDLYEINSSKLVLDTSHDDSLKTFAQMMVDDHTKSTADVVAAAKSSGMNPAPPKLMPKQAAMIASLQKASGKSRDSLYKKQQVAAHQQALTLQQSYATNGTDPNLKAAAGNIVPVVEHHLSQVKQMAM